MNALNQVDYCKFEMAKCAQLIEDARMNATANDMESVQSLLAKLDATLRQAATTLGWLKAHAE